MRQTPPDARMNLLHQAVIDENVEVVEFLLKHGVPVNGRARIVELSITFDTDEEHQKYHDAMVSTGSRSDNNNEQEDGKKRDEDDVGVSKTTTALHLASRQESPRLVELLLAAGAEVDAQMEGGETALVVAALCRREAAAKLLLDAGARVDSRTLWGKTSLHYAAQTGHCGVLRALLERGAATGATDCDGMAPVHLSAEAGHREAVALLAGAKAELGLRAANGATALHYAVVMGHREVVELLLAQGCSIYALLKNGKLDVAAFPWLTAEDEARAWNLVARYKKNGIINAWYQSVVMKLRERST